MSWQDALARSQRVVVQTFADRAPDGTAQPVIYHLAEGGTVELSDFVWQDQYEAYDPDTGASYMSSDPMISVVEADIGRAAAKGDEVERLGILYSVAERRKDGQGMVHLSLIEGGNGA